MFNGGQSPASILSPICTKNCTGHSNRINHETYPEPCFPAPQLYLLIMMPVFQGINGLDRNTIQGTINKTWRYR